MNDVAFSVDQAALAGIGVAGAISISSAEGPYTPFDSILGIVLFILFVSFYESKVAESENSTRFQAAPAAVLALLTCLILSSVVELGWHLALADRLEIAVDATLAALWIALFFVALVLPVGRKLRHVVAKLEVWRRALVAKTDRKSDGNTGA